MFRRWIGSLILVCALLVQGVAVAHPAVRHAEAGVDISQQHCLNDGSADKRDQRNHASHCGSCLACGAAAILIQAPIAALLVQAAQPKSLRISNETAPDVDVASSRPPARASPKLS